MTPSNVHEWSGGCPNAHMGDVATTRYVWAPFIDGWCQEMERDFTPMLEKSVYRGHLGWCDNEKLWTTYWQQLALQPEDTWLEAFGAYMPWAAAAGSMAYFRAMPAIFWPLMQVRFNKLDLIVHPDAVVWYEEQCGDNLDGKIRSEQLARWYGIEWMVNQHRALGEARSDKWGCMDEYIELCARAIEVYGFGENQQSRMLGHLFMGPTQEAAMAGMVERIQKRLGPLLANGLDVRLVGLCSGYAFHGLKAEESSVEDVYRIARRFIQAQQKREFLNSSALVGGGYTAMMLTSMPVFNNWEGLYQAVQSMGFFSFLKPLDLGTALDGGIFDTDGMDVPPG